MNPRLLVEDFNDALEFARCLLVLATQWAAAQDAGHNEGVAPSQTVEEVAPVSEHPADVDLVAFADSELDEVTTGAIRGHVDGCSRCARLLESLLQPLEMDMTSTPAVGSVDLSTMFQRRPDEDPDVGEVWRAEWDTAGLIVLVTGRTDGAVHGELLNLRRQVTSHQT